MNLESILHFLIYLHAGLGGIALLAGLVALGVQKGSTPHKVSGKIYASTMLISALLSVGIALSPGHVNFFLASIGLFTSYFILSGYRSLRFQQQGVSLGTDRLISSTMLVVGVGMVGFSFFLGGGINYVLLVFGAIGAVFALRDLRLYRQLERLQKSWLRLHLGKMCGGYIASVTAFLVVNELLPGLFAWFVPTVIGSVFIAYWMRRVRKQAEAE